VALNVRRLRQRKGYTREALARAAGVEPALIDAIELATCQPTITMLWSVATALGVPFSALVSTAVDAQRDSDLVPGRAPESAEFVCRPVLPSQRGPRRTEVYEFRLAPLARRSAAARPAGAVDNLLVTSGEVVLHVGEARHALRTGDSVEFRSDVERSYENLTDQTVTMYVVITYASQHG
jgi:transcriptional regulator with XRE-family HTH domain